MAGEVSITMYSGPRHYGLDKPTTDHASLYISSSSDMLGQTDGFSVRMFASQAQLRELRDLLNGADLGDDEEYDVAYAATARAWEAIGVS